MLRTLESYNVGKICCQNGKHTQTHLLGTYKHTYLLHTDTLIWYTQTHLLNTHRHIYLLHTDTLT